MKQPVVKKPSRSDATRLALMRAAEKLIASKGAHAVTLRGIIDTAGQKNESALQYHFKNLHGLIRAIHLYRGEQLAAERELFISELMARNSKPDLREICVVVVGPVFQLASSDAEFRQYLKAFGHEIMSDARYSFVMARRSTKNVNTKVTTLLYHLLTDLDVDTFRHRLETSVRLVAASVYDHVQQKNAFRGAAAEIFYHQLIDTLVGVLGAPESAQTSSVRKKAAKKRAIKNPPEKKQPGGKASTKPVRARPVK